jgi:DNA invertase Pin-like site-specific DNA recombinase
MKRVAIYARMANNEGDIGSQVRTIEDDVCAVGWRVVAIYKDAAASGLMLARPAMSRLRADSTAGGFDVVAVESVDRLSRGAARFLEIQRGLKPLNTAIWSRQSA